MTTQHREFEIRSVNDETREVSGLAVPFNSVINVGGFRESFERGAIDSHEGVKLFWNHSEIIGKLTRGAETEDGYEVTAVISATARGNEAYTLLKDGVVDKFSVGFIPVDHRDEDGVIVRTKVNLKEVSLVPFPAYEGASVTEVRAQKETVHETETTPIGETMENSNEFAELRGTVEELERRMTDFSVPQQRTADSQYRTGGEALKALLAGDEAAKTEFRAFNGATTVESGSPDSWLNRTVRLVQENRNVLNLFSKAPHPGTLSITLPVLGSVAGSVAVTGEGVDLPYLEVAFSDKQFNNAKYGGYSSVSREAIELGTPGYLSKVLEYQALSYAKVTNTAVRNAVAAATGTETVNRDANTFKGWSDVIVDAVSRLNSNGSGASADFIVVSTDVFKALASINDGAGRPLLQVNGDGSNTVGSASVRGLRGTILGLPVVVDAGATLGTTYITSSEAVTVMESAGAPVRLQDENIINLTKDFSLYGYMIVAVTNPLAIVKVTDA